MAKLPLTNAADKMFRLELHVSCRISRTMINETKRLGPSRNCYQTASSCFFFLFQAQAKQIHK